MKIVVYAIARNEAKFAARWMASMREADEVVVLDTGSRDGTAKALRKLGAKVTRRMIRPWRFDVARNESMKLAPSDADLLVCTDLDEVLRPGWRRLLEEAWGAAAAAGRNPTTATYDYIWSFDENGHPAVQFRYEKIHRPGICRWIYPVHEVLRYDVPRENVAVPGLTLEHHPDGSKSRGAYLGLLELSVTENPDDVRGLHYLGREYYFYRRWDDAIALLERHLAHPNSTWRAERAASMRYIARCYGEKGDRARQTLWLWKAIAEATQQREAAYDLLKLANAAQDWKLAAEAGSICLARRMRTDVYLTEGEVWGEKPWGHFAVALFKLGRMKAAAAAYARYESICRERGIPVSAIGKGAA